MIKSRRFVASIFAAATLAALGTAVTSSPASAVNCTISGNECAWSGANRTGYFFTSFYSVYSYGNTDYSGQSVQLWNGDGNNANVSSAQSKDPAHNTVFYYNSGYRGACLGVGPNGYIGNFARFTLENGSGAGNANERIGSHHFNYPCSNTTIGD